MILSFDREISEIANAIGCEQFDSNTGMKIAMILATVFDKGLSDERDRNIRIVQKMAMSPMPIVTEMRKMRR